ncbi:hypothetical protein GGR21_000410 [Dysgonomonas hofstadii]|uniref:Ankyrin repeat protein n=1 Tax=Dysgonomonas hofstadii TaxID=637886 RepID=A0A840CNF3_9BACT|nr:hypothetical protein [Dysgonomonas hofstadii]
MLNDSETSSVSKEILRSTQNDKIHNKSLLTQSLVLSRAKDFTPLHVLVFYYQNPQSLSILKSIIKKNKDYEVQRKIS